MTNDMRRRTHRGMMFEEAVWYCPVERECVYMYIVWRRCLGRCIIRHEDIN